MAKIGIFVGTVYGNALAVAEEAQRILLEHKHQANIYEEGTLADWQKYSTVLVISSTTRFYHKMRNGKGLVSYVTIIAFVTKNGFGG